MSEKIPPKPPMSSEDDAKYSRWDGFNWIDESRFAYKPPAGPDSDGIKIRKILTAVFEEAKEKFDLEPMEVIRLMDRAIKRDGTLL